MPRMHFVWCRQRLLELCSQKIETQRLLLGASAWLEDSGANVQSHSQWWVRDDTRMPCSACIWVDWISYSESSVYFTAPYHVHLMCKSSWKHVFAPISSLNSNFLGDFLWRGTVNVCVGWNALYWEMGQTLRQPKLSHTEPWTNNSPVVFQGDLGYWSAMEQSVGGVWSLVFAEKHVGGWCPNVINH